MLPRAGKRTRPTIPRVSCIAARFGFTRPIEPLGPALPLAASFPPVPKAIGRVRDGGED